MENGSFHVTQKTFLFTNNVVYNSLPKVKDRLTDHCLLKKVFVEDLIFHE